jgi:glycopeptide antibiotics resistance protein
MMMDLLFRFNYIFDADRLIERSYNLIPLKTILTFASSIGRVWDDFSISNIFGNIVLFIPLGVYARALRKKGKILRCLITVIITVTAVELIQLGFGLGVCDIDDVLLNSLGGLIGILGYMLFVKAFKGESQAKTVVTVVSVLVGTPVIYLYFTTVFNHLRL